MGVFDGVAKAVYDQMAARYDQARAEHAAVLANSVPMPVHDRVVAQLERQIASLQRSSERYVAREVHDAVVAGLENQLSAVQALLTQAQDQLKTTLTETLAIKRGEMNMGGKDFDPAKMDSMYGLGPKTEAAIEEFANGDPQIRKHLIQQARVDMLGPKSRGATSEEIDEQVAELIRRGDTG